MRAHNVQLEAQIMENRDQDEQKGKSQTRQWEQTFEDLTKELKGAQATIVEKSTLF